MTKQEMELSQAFTALATKVRELRVFQHLTKDTISAASLGAWLRPVEDSLESFKKKFYNIMLEIEEPE